MNKLFIAALVAAVAAAAADLPARGVRQSDDDAAASKKVWTSNCSHCHHVPDPAVKRDEVWLDMIQTTA